LLFLLKDCKNPPDPHISHRPLRILLAASAHSHNADSFGINQQSNFFVIIVGLH